MEQAHNPAPTSRREIAAWDVLEAPRVVRFLMLPSRRRLRPALRVPSARRRQRLEECTAMRAGRLPPSADPFAHWLEGDPVWPEPRVAKFLGLGMARRERAGCDAEASRVPDKYQRAGTSRCVWAHGTMR